MEIVVLLVNLGTPEASDAASVKRYLIEFLTDPRVIDRPWLLRQLLVRGIIVPARYRTSAKYYRAIWTDEGSPLLVHGRRVQALLQEALGAPYRVELTMRYQTPSIAETLAKLASCSIKQLIVLPLFPQYASATTGSVHEAVMREVCHWPVIPELTFVNSYAIDPQFIEAFAQRIRAEPLNECDKLLFSFHGLPEAHIRKADCKGRCLQKGCCDEMSGCYSSQCYATARAIAHRLNIGPECYTVCFQSRLGREPWLKPYTSDVLEQLARDGFKRVLAVCPAFVADCLETLYEIGVEYAEEFRRRGGEWLKLVPSLNDSPLWIQALRGIIQARSVLK